MQLIPSRKLTIVTQLAPEDAETALAKRVQPGHFLSGLRRTHHLFEGRVQQRRFQIFAINWHKRSWYSQWKCPWFPAWGPFRYAQCESSRRHRSCGWHLRVAGRIEPHGEGARVSARIVDDSVWAALIGPIGRTVISTFLILAFLLGIFDTGRLELPTLVLPLVVLYGYCFSRRAWSTQFQIKADDAERFLEDTFST